LKNKIYHGPLNIGGIGGYISKYLRSKGYSSEFIVWYDFTMRYNHDHNLHIDSNNIVLKILKIFTNFLKVSAKYDIFHFYGGKTLLPYGLDLPILKMIGKKTIMTYCGTESRLISYVESKRNPYFYLLKIGHNHEKYDDRKVRMIKWHGFWCDKIIAIRDSYKNAIFVVNKNKVLDQPWIHNLGFNTDNLTKNIKTNKIPIIIHSPSNPEIKGTKYIEKAINNMREKGLKFEYKRLEKIPNDIAQNIYKKSDIIIDQLLIGSFGTLAIEGMGYGKPVVCYIMDDIKDNYCPDCPIFNANINNIEERLTTLVKDSNLRIELGKKGVEFVKKYLDNATILKAMEKIYEEL
jgi:glycosyltransferase involved in cell wall biosynthesis